MQATVQQPHRAPDGDRVRYERHRPEQTTLYRLVQQHAATFFAETEAAAEANRPQFVKDEFDAFDGSGCGRGRRECCKPSVSRLNCWRWMVATGRPAPGGRQRSNAGVLL